MKKACNPFGPQASSFGGEGVRFRRTADSIKPHQSSNVSGR
jgi:hypothetical protein